MQSKIHLLSDETINQIAAGEVIESPASVVKELVENAIDAGSTKITIEITGGGLKLIKIVDDGEGMALEDAKSCIMRHATSKITKAQDLFSIATNGFRGEALASIASIAKMEIVTALEGASGIKLEIEEGKVVSEKPAARTKGTTMQVRSLFYNVPARKKFQKSGAAIAAEIYRMVILLALGHPQVHFELISNGRKAIKTTLLGLEPRAQELLGDEFTKGSFPVSFEEGPLRFTGIAGAPTNTRANKMGQYLFLNKRGVVCEPIIEAVRLGYGTRLEERRHPIFLLHLSVPPDLIDVNVHPQKLHVRLRKEELIRDKVQVAIFSALQTSKEPSIATGEFTPTRVHFEEKVSFRFEEEPTHELPFEEESAKFLGQMGQYLLFQQSGELIFLDGEAASYRVQFEQLNKSLDLASQRLLIPFSATFTSVESAMLLTHLDAIEAFGFSLKPIGKDAFMIEALPPFLDEQQVQNLLQEMAHDLQEFIGGKEYINARQEKLALRLASSVKRKKQYLPTEALQLWKSLQTCESSLHCPKGNPTMVQLENDKIQELFRSSETATKSP
ncbi:MAG: DNA mismatch repair endonuclease MutL [Simkaniaceae bacterium]|nr:DNA mismatch repair endonuclease MutL [Candidatus Sacchlamyda saccharinae]